MNKSLLGAALLSMTVLTGPMARPQRTNDSAALIADATSAAPLYISKNATIMNWQMRERILETIAQKPPQGTDWYHAGPPTDVRLSGRVGEVAGRSPQDPSTGEPYIRPMPDENAAILVVPVAKPLEEIRTIRTGQ